MATYTEVPQPTTEPVAPVTPVATAPVVTPTAPVVTTPPPVAPNPLLTSVNPDAVYSPTNIQQIDIPSTKKAMDMKLSSLEKKLAKANSIADLNQIEIMNQPKAMGVLTGEAAYRSKLDSARVSAFNALYQNKILDMQRKEAKKQAFIAQYGADPGQRPKGMSEREFIKALQGGRFSHLLTQDFKAKQLDLAAKQKSLSGSGGAAGSNKELKATADAYTKFGGDWTKTADYLASQGYDVSSGSTIDTELRRRNNLPPIATKAPTKQELNTQIQQKISQITDWGDQTPEDQAAYIRSLGGDPKDFGL